MSNQSVVLQVWTPPPDTAMDIVLQCEMRWLELLNEILINLISVPRLAECSHSHKYVLCFHAADRTAGSPAAREMLPP